VVFGGRPLDFAGFAELVFEREHLGRRRVSKPPASESIGCGEVVPVAKGEVQEEDDVKIGGWQGGQYRILIHW
jgi:hypothetical protein